MATDQEVTSQILSAWDEMQEEEENAQTDTGGDSDEVVTDDELSAAVVTEPETEEPEEDTEEDTEQAGEDDEEEPAEEGEVDEEEGEADEEPVAAGFETEDPEILAYLAKYSGNPEEALKAAANLERVLGRQGRENGQLKDRVRELEVVVQRQQAITPTVVLNQEQREWVETAVESGDPTAFVREALNAEAFDLAHAVCEQWAEERPYEAARLASYVDHYKQQAQQQQQQVAQEAVVVDHAAVMEVLVEHFPQMPTYEPQMLSVMETLGANHPLVVDARSNDPETSAHAIIGIYEIAGRRPRQQSRRRARTFARPSAKRRMTRAALQW